MTIEYWVKTTQTSLTGSQWYNGSGIVDAEVAGGTSDFGTSLLNGKLAFGIGNPDITLQSTTSINTGVCYTKKVFGSHTIFHRHGYCLDCY